MTIKRRTESVAVRMAKTLKGVTDKFPPLRNEAQAWREWKSAIVK